MWTQLKNISQKFCDVLELLLAMIVSIALIVSILLFLPEVFRFVISSPSPHAFLNFLEEVLGLVVGVEFLKMLCKPSTENVIEVLVFLVARHMILSSNTAVDQLISILAICALFLTRAVMKYLKSKAGEQTLH